MGAATAGETPTVTDNATMNTIDDVQVSVSADTGGAEPMLGVSNEENILTADTGSGSFKDLETYIRDNKGYEKTVILNQDYTFNSETDSDYVDTGVYLGTYTVIDGQGHTIDANNTPTNIFNIIGQDIVLKNINFKNANGAVLVDSPNVKIMDCTFDNSTAYSIKATSSASNFVTDTCKFYNGQGIISQVSGAIIKNSIFENNTASNGAAITISAGENIIDNCIFKNNTATLQGGAIYFNSKNNNLTITDSQFINNGAVSGGAIYNNCWSPNYDTGTLTDSQSCIIIENSSFNNNIAVNSPNIFGHYECGDSISNGEYYDSFDSLFNSVDGIITTPTVINLDDDYTLTHGPITLYVVDTSLTINGNGHTINANGNQAFQIYEMHISDYMSSVIINNISFENGYSPNDGGIIYIEDYGKSVGNVTLKYCNFTNNTAGRHGGAVYLRHLPQSFSFQTCNISYCNFINNTAGHDGGAVYVTWTARRPNLVSYCNFTNNTAKNEGGALFLGGAGTLSNITFTNNSAMGMGALRLNSGQNIGYANNISFYNNSALSDPNTNKVDSINDPIGDLGIISSDLPEYFNSSSAGIVNLPENTIFNYPATIQNIVSTNLTIIGHNTTIIGQQNAVFFLYPRNVLTPVVVKNITFVNCTVKFDYDNGFPSFYGYIIENCTFINCTPAIDCTSGCEIKDSNFINCTQIITSNYVRTNFNITNITIDGKRYDNRLYEYLGNLNSSVNNQVIEIPGGDYEIIAPIGMFADNVTITNKPGETVRITNILGGNIFNFVTSNTTIQNLILKTNATAITYNTGNTLYSIDRKTYQGPINYVKNVTFEECGLGIYYQFTSNANMETSVGYVENCNFTDSKRGIYFGSNGTVINSTFNNVRGSNDGAGIYFNENGYVDNCNFTETAALGKNGGAIYIKNNVNITKSNFINCSALSGGAIYQANGNGLGIVNVSKSTFDGDEAKSSGGAIYVEDILILDTCDLNNNTADSSGAIYGGGSLTVTNSSLTNNSAVKGGGIVSDGDNAIISDCDVSGNTAVVGAGISLNGDNATVDNVTFTDNAAEIEGGALITTGSGTNITNVTATGNSANKGAAFSLKGDNSIIANSTIANNTGINDGNIVNVEGNNICVLNNTIQNNTGIGLYIRGNDTNITNNHFNNLTDISIDPTSNVYEQLPMEKIAEDNYPMGGMPLKEIVPTIIAKNVTVEENTVFNITLVNNDFTGNVSITVGDIVLYNDTIIPFKDGAVYCPVISVGGDKTAQVFFYGDNAFRNKTVDVDFIVSRITPTMNVTINNVTYGINTTAKINISNKADGTVNITFGEITVNGSVVDGSAVIDLGMLVPDNYTAIIEFFPTDSDYYNNVSDTSSFNVSKANATLIVTTGQNNVFAYGDNVTVFISLVDSHTLVVLNETITVVINNTPRTVEVINGETSFNVSGFEPGQYSVMGEFEDENYNSPVYDSAVFEVLYPNRILSIETADEIMEGAVAVINVTVTDSNGNKVKGTVVLNISGTEVVVIVDGNKSVEIADLPAGIYTVNATLVEEGLYAEVVNDTETFKVSAKEDIVINVADVVITVGDTAVINASLHSSTAAENLTITVVGKDSQVVTIDDNGNASAEFTGLAAGEYEIIVTYGGDNIWNAATANATLTVNKINTD